MRRRSELEDVLLTANGRTVLDAILKTTPSIAVIADSNGQILRVSRHATALSGLSAEEMEGLSLDEFCALVEPRAPDGRLLKPEQSPLARALKGRVQIDREGFFRDRHGERVPILSNVAPFRNSSGKVIGAISSVTDLRAFRALEAELRATVAEKEMLYRELAHRVKNHLQVVSGLVELEARHEVPGVKDFAERVSGRLQLLAAIYDSVIAVESGGRIHAGPFIQQAVQPYRSETVEVAVTAPKGATLAPDHAGPLGMLVNEAVCNSYKHAFPERCGKIAVTLGRGGPRGVKLEITDTGVGFTPAAGSASQGIRLMRLLAQQLGGELTISPRTGGGTKVAARLPISIGAGPALAK